MIAMPNVVIGLNDHGLFGYYLRLYLMHAMPRFAWARDMALRPVEVETLAQGLCLAAEHGRPGASYHFGGPRQTVGEIFGHWSRHPGATAPRLWLPRSVVRCQLALAEPLLRRLGMPAFLSREAVECSQANLDYRSTRAERELGWQHADAASTWDRIVMAERLRMSRHHGWRDRLRHEALA